MASSKSRRLSIEITPAQKKMLKRLWKSSLTEKQAKKYMRVINELKDRGLVQFKRKYRLTEKGHKLVRSMAPKLAKKVPRIRIDPKNKLGIKFEEFEKAAEGLKKGSYAAYDQLLDKAIAKAKDIGLKKYGMRTVMQRITAIRNLTKNTDPEASKAIARVQKEMEKDKRWKALSYRPSKKRVSKKGKVIKMAERKKAAAGRRKKKSSVRRKKKSSVRRRRRKVSGVASVGAKRKRKSSKRRRRRKVSGVASVGKRKRKSSKRRRRRKVSKGVASVGAKRKRKSSKRRRRRKVSKGVASVGKRKRRSSKRRSSRRKKKAAVQKVRRKSSKRRRRRSSKGIASVGAKRKSSRRRRRRRR